MKICFFGVGSIAKRHILIIKELYPDIEIYALRREGVMHEEDETGCTFYDETITKIVKRVTIDEIKNIKPDVAFICNPTNLHIETAIQCANLGMHLFIEKPIDSSTEKLNELIEIVDKQKLICYIAYPFRFNRMIETLKNSLELKDDKMYYNGNQVFTMHIDCRSDLKKWRPYKTYSSYFDKGGGALLELSHEFYIAEYLFGDIVAARASKLYTSKYTNAESCAQCDLEHSTGRFSTIYVDIDSSREQRTLSMFGVGATFTIDYKNPEAFRDMYISQIKYFFKSLEKGSIQINEIKSVAPLFKRLIDLRSKK